MQTRHFQLVSTRRANKTHITKAPKTKAGIREFMLSASAIQLLKEYPAHQAEQIVKLGDAWEDTDRLFTAWNGKTIHPDTITSWFAAFVRRNGFPHVALHSLRHTNATLLLSKGTDVSTVSKRLGHANTSVTLDIYAHALKSKDVEAANTLDNLLAF